MNKSTQLCKHIHCSQHHHHPGMRTTLRHASQLLHREAATPHASILAFLCPALLRSQPVTGFPPQNLPRPKKTFSTFGRKRTPDTAIATPSPLASSTPPAPQPDKRALPICCPGCGAPTQILASSEAGYYSLSRGAVKSHLNYDDSQPKATEDDIFTKAIKQVDNKVLEDLGLDRTVLCEYPLAARLLHH